MFRRQMIGRKFDSGMSRVITWAGAATLRTALSIPSIWLFLCRRTVIRAPSVASRAEFVRRRCHILDRVSSWLSSLGHPGLGITWLQGGRAALFHPPQHRLRIGRPSETTIAPAATPTTSAPLALAAGLTEARAYSRHLRLGDRAGFRKEVFR